MLRDLRTITNVGLAKPRWAQASCKDGRRLPSRPYSLAVRFRLGLIWHFQAPICLRSLHRFLLHAFGDETDIKACTAWCARENRVESSASLGHVRRHRGLVLISVGSTRRSMTFNYSAVIGETAGARAFLKTPEVTGQRMRMKLPCAREC